MAILDGSSMRAERPTQPPGSRSYDSIVELFKSTHGVLAAEVLEIDGSPSRVVTTRRLALKLPVTASVIDTLAEAAKSSLHIAHEGIVSLVDVDRGANELLIASEYFDSEHLATIFQLQSAHGSGMPAPIAARIAVDVLGALSFLSSAPSYAPGGLTAESVLVCADGRTRIFEPALIGRYAKVNIWARRPDQWSSAAPEKLDGEGELDERSDIFSAGVLLWEMLSGKRLFRGLTYDKTVANIRSGKVPPLTSDHARREELDAVIKKALATKVSRRYHSPAAFGHALRQAIVELATREDVAAYVDRTIGASAKHKRISLAIGAARERLGLTEVDFESARPASTPLPMDSGPPFDSQPPPDVDELTNASYRRAGRCELFVELAHGGMATVYLGRWLGAGGFAKVVAVKAMHSQYARDPNFTKMFLDEARVVARIRHPNVMPTIDFVDEDGELYIVMDYIEGVTLARLLRQTRKRKERPPIGVVMRIITGALHGLHAAHEATDEKGNSMGIIHRDVSPDNILVGVDGYARIIDFGIATALERHATTRDGEIKGKLSYMAPEQLLEEELGPYTDVFSASVVLWQTLTGRKLYKGKNAGETTLRVLHSETPPPSRIVRLDKRYDAIVLKGLEKRPAHRWQTAQAMAEAIEAEGRLASHREVGEWVRTVASRHLQQRAALVTTIENAPKRHASDDNLNRKLSIHPAPPVDDRPTVDEGGSRTSGARFRPAYVLALVAAGALAGAGFILSRSDDAPESSPTTDTEVAPTVSVTATSSQPPPTPVSGPLTVPSTPVPSAAPTTPVATTSSARPRQQPPRYVPGKRRRKGVKLPSDI